MQYRQIPNTTLNPSVLCLGALPFGVSLDEATSFALLDRFAAAGGNFLDTALVYGEWLSNGRGRNEQTIGRWLKSRANRAQIILGTKGAHPFIESMTIPRLSRAEIVADIDASLLNLQTDYIDLYWLHRDDPTRPVADILTTLNDQVEAGKLRYFGCSNWRLDRIQEAQTYAAAHNLQPFSANQVQWSLAIPNPAFFNDPTMVAMDAPMHAYHTATNLAAIPYVSQARGYFTRLESTPLSDLPADLRRNFDNEENTRRLARLRALSADLHQPIGLLALAYLLSQPFPTYPIAGATTLPQLAANLPAANLHLTPAMLDYLEHGD